MWQLPERTHVELDRSIDELPLTERFKTRMSLTFGDGTTDTASVSAPHGYPPDPVTDDEVVTRFHRLVDPVMPCSVCPTPRTSRHWWTNLAVK